VYIVDANVLLYAADSTSRDHAACRDWLVNALNGSARVGLPAQSIGAFLRISTHPRVMDRPLNADEAWSIASAWLDAPAAWVPVVTDRTLAVLGELVVTHAVTGNLVTDAQLAAQAIEHGLAVVTLDTDFARFPVHSIDPRTHA
jgi:toxin-antitoxin system PIN domain toxin